MLANPVFTLDLAKYHDNRSRPALPTYNDYELDRQMFSIMPCVPPGTNVRFLVHGYLPQGQCLTWLRPDLNVQIDATDPTVIAAWISALSEEGVAA